MVGKCDLALGVSQLPKATVGNFLTKLSLDVEIKFQYGNLLEFKDFEFLALITKHSSIDS